MAEEAEPKRKAARKVAKPAKARSLPPATAAAKAEPAPTAPPRPAPRPSPSLRPVRDIGLDVPPPATVCADHHCPFHGSLRVRGQMLEGVVVSAGMEHTVIVERQRLRYIPKFERYEKRTRRIPAHAPPCLGLTVGSRVALMECRPLSKTVSFVAIHNRGAAA